MATAPNQGHIRPMLSDRVAGLLGAAQTMIRLEYCALATGISMIARRGRAAGARAKSSFRRFQRRNSVLGCGHAPMYGFRCIGRLSRAPGATAAATEWL